MPELPDVTVYVESIAKRVVGEPLARAHVAKPFVLRTFDAPRDAFAERLRSENHTLKRALTDPRLFSGIGNAFSDEILHRARLSPLTLTSRIGDDDVTRLHDAVRTTLAEWTARLRAEVGD